MISVPATNWRMVRPREMRARNSPTNDAQAIHQAQKKSVQALSHSSGRSKANVSSVSAGKELTKSPTFCTSPLSRNTVSPATRRKSASPIARITLSWLSSLMPRSTPVTADTVAMATARATSPTWAAVPSGIPKRKVSP